MSINPWEKFKGVNSGVIMFIDGRGYDAIELMSGKFDDKLDDPPIAKNDALRKIISATLSNSWSFSKWTDVFKAVLADANFHFVGKGCAVLALAKVDTQEAHNYLKSLTDDKSLETYADLARALYLIGDEPGLDKLKTNPHNNDSFMAAMRRAALSWQAQGKWCPSMDSHGLCVQGLRAEYCGLMSYPYDRERKVASSSTVKLPTNTNYLYCPVYQRRGIFP